MIQTNEKIYSKGKHSICHFLKTITNLRLVLQFQIGLLEKQKKGREVYFLPVHMGVVTHSPLTCRRVK